MYEIPEETMARTPYLFALGILAGGLAAPALQAALPGEYFKLMASEVNRAQSSPELRFPSSYALSAAVLYTRQHPANPAYGDERLLGLALKFGDLAAQESERDNSVNRQDYEWEIHFWLDTYRLLDGKLSDERRARWRKQLERNVRWFAHQTEARLDFPRYQGSFIRTSTNHYALFASTTYLAGRVFKHKEWEDLGARALHRLAAEEQAEGGYWGEYTDNGPATNYNYITMTCVALYYEHSLDTAALEALRRATDFHRHFTWPNGQPVETVNGRNRYGSVSPWGNFGFSHWPEGRGYAEFLAQFFEPGRTSGRNLGRVAQNALYYHEGPVEQTPQKLAQAVHRLPVPAGIRRTAPWTVCLSGLHEPPTSSQFTLDRQGNLGIYHDRLGLILTGAGSKRQPELATIMERAEGSVLTVPVNSRLRMSDALDRLGMGFRKFFVELHVPRPEPERLAFEFKVTEVGPKQMGEAEINLQLVLEPGQTLETARTKIALSDQRVELGPEQIGGWIRHRGWTLRVPPGASLTWPVMPFNPYRNAPETDLRYAVGRLRVPIQVQPWPQWELGWGRQDIRFTLEAPR